MARLTLPDGRWIEIRPQFIREQNAIRDLNDRTPPDTPILDYLNDLLVILRPAVTETSWDGDVDELTPKQALLVMREWPRVTEDDAFPPVPGTSSGTTLPEPAFPATEGE